MPDLSPKHSHLEKEDCSPLKITNSIADPVLHLSRKDGTNRASLAGKIIKQGRVSLVGAETLSHDWISDGKFIRPLPADSPNIVAGLLDGFNPQELTYPQILSLRSRVESSAIELQISDEILEDATTASRRFNLKEKPKGLQIQPYRYQEQGIAWMQDTLHKMGGLVLADEMGLGKTLQIIALLLLEKPTTKEPALIVCPTSLLANWGKELMKFAPSLTWRIHRGPERARIHTQLSSTEILLTTYDTLVSDQLLLETANWTFLICDEAQALKNPDSQRRDAVARMPRKFTIPLTGTPVETSLLDLWSLCDIAIPGLLGTRDEFAVTYPDSVSSAESVSTVTDPVVLKRRLGDVADQLPERTNVEIPISLEGDLARGYESTRQTIVDAYPTAGQLVAAGQLALFCAHPWLSCKEPTAENWEENVEFKKREGYELITPKLSICLDLLESAFAAGRKVLIFSAYNQVADILKKSATDLSAAYWDAINGATPAEDRQQIVDDFTSHSGNAVLVLNPKAAGAGLNIQAATVVIHFTQYWNPALEAQSSARAHRTGQKQPVTVYYLYYEDTVERIMLDRTAFRKDMANAAVVVTNPDDGDLINALTITPFKK